MNYYKMYNSIYNKGYRKKKKLKKSFTQEIDNLIACYPIQNILDVGCSYGETVKYFQDKKIDARGIDVADKPIRESAASCNCGKGSALSIPYSNNNFDAIICIDVLEHIHVDDLFKVIQEFNRVTNQYLFLKIATKIEKQKQWSKFLQIPQIHLSVFPIERWIALFLHYGSFNLIEIKDKWLIMVKVKK